MTTRQKCNAVSPLTVSKTALNTCSTSQKLPERFSITLLEGTNVLSKASMTTEEFIKPKTPVVKVLKNDSGNFIVTWNDQYEKNGLLGQFLQNLRINLTYEGGHENITRVLQNTVGSFEIVGKNLKPNTKYILTATMSTDYNAHTISSDQSAPVEFTTSSSPNEIAKILIPPLCVGLIIIILIIFISVLSMKRNWWDKISKPKIDANLGEEKDHILPLSVMEFSPIHVEISTLDLQEENKLISAVSVDTNNGRSSHSIETTPVKYGQACSGSQEENICTINIPSCVEHALDEVFKLHPITKNLLPPNNQVTTIRSYSSVNIVHSSRECNSANQDSGSSSGPMVFSNMSYVESATDDSLYVEHLSEDHYHQSSKREVSDSSNGQFNSPTIDTLEDEYQGFNSVLNKRNDSDVRVNLSNDAGEKCIMKNLITSTNPSLILHDGSITLSDEGYQAFQGLTKSTEGQWCTSVRTEQALDACGALKFPHSNGQDRTSVQPSSWTSSLHFSPIIQIESSYQPF
ncbi:uncharacterized protein LOC127162801 isoform X2 [Labeo rohita]|uniref:uncharacterized protein LOC127162801 isoform X2 n=1 Tax=Labeo rohita TaxID=84645 RepID=UPI0021E336AC|nr:uncharacterized protein LOC127162801 isoform X2 [Labeo rohita]